MSWYRLEMSLIKKVYVKWPVRNISGKHLSGKWTNLKLHLIWRGKPFYTLRILLVFAYTNEYRSEIETDVWLEKLSKVVEINCFPLSYSIFTGFEILLASGYGLLLQTSILGLRRVRGQSQFGPWLAWILICAVDSCWVVWFISVIWGAFTLKSEGSDIQKLRLPIMNSNLYKKYYP